MFLEYVSPPRRYCNIGQSNRVFSVGILDKNEPTFDVFREIDVSALPSLGEGQILVMLGESLLDFVPFRVVWWIIRKIGEAPGRGFAVLWRTWCERGPVACRLDIIPGDAREERDSYEGSEYAEEIDGGLQVSPWNYCLNGVRRSRWQDGRSHGVVMAPNRLGRS